MRIGRIHRRQTVYTSDSTCHKTINEAQLFTNEKLTATLASKLLAERKQTNDFELSSNKSGKIKKSEQLYQEVNEIIPCKDKTDFVESIQIDNSNPKYETYLICRESIPQKRKIPVFSENNSFQEGKKVMQCRVRKLSDAFPMEDSTEHNSGIAHKSMELKSKSKSNEKDKFIIKASANLLDVIQQNMHTPIKRKSDNIKHFLLFNPKRKEVKINIRGNTIKPFMTNSMDRTYIFDKGIGSSLHNEKNSFFRSSTRDKGLRNHQRSIGFSTTESIPEIDKLSQISVKNSLACHIQRRSEIKEKKVVISMPEKRIKNNPFLPQKQKFIEKSGTLLCHARRFFRIKVSYFSLYIF